ncbi:MAG TPA: amidase [Longimicrobiales bacterium]
MRHPTHGRVAIGRHYLEAHLTEVCVRRGTESAAMLATPLVELLAQLRRGEISPVELMDAHIRRIEAVNPAINALVAERFAAAQREAVEAEREYGTTARPRPLLGIPFTVKEMIEVRGMPLTFGSSARRDRRGVRDATVVSRLRAAGAIPVGVSNVPEWGMWFESYNGLYGRTRNPWNLRHTPGGSSGGEGALVGAGASVFGVGSDIGGSVRIPAAFCGVFGHKPTTGMLPLTGHYPVYATGPDAVLSKKSPYVTIGTLSRSAADIPPLMRCMAGRDGLDPNSEPVAFLSPERVEWRGRRVLLITNPLIDRAGETAPELREAVEHAGRVLEARGAYVDHAPNRLFRHAGDIWFGALQSASGPAFREVLGDGRPVRLPLEVVRTLVGLGRYSWPALFFCLGEQVGKLNEQGLRRALREFRRLARLYRALLGDDGVLVTPVHPRTAPRHNAAVLRPFDFLYTAVFNALRVPATTAPCGLDASGLPLAVQFASVHGRDHLTIAAAAALEESIEAWRPALVQDPVPAARD